MTATTPTLSHTSETKQKHFVFLYIIVNKGSLEIISKHMARNENKGEMRQVMKV